MASTHQHHVINIDAVATKLHQMMRDNQLFMLPSCCIFRVPTILRRHNPKAYTPNAFSIGPFHHKKLPLWKTTHKIKIQYLDHFVSRPWQNVPFTENNRMLRLRTITEVVTNVQEAASRCYAGLQSFNASEFVQVLVLDGCFLIELFRKKAFYDDHEPNNDDDPIFSTSCWLQNLFHDLILQENQIPWIVLKDLFEITRSDNDTKTLIELALGFGFFGCMTRPRSIESILSKLEKSKHILDLIRNSLVMSSNVQADRTVNWQPMPSATRLREAGIKFTNVSSYNKCILDIQFKSGVLEIPSLFFQESTESVFRNLISLEQCCPNYDPIITSYAMLMDNLINTNEDMEILTKNGVIRNWLNIDDATNFFNKLYNDTCIKAIYYNDLTLLVNNYCGNRWPRWRMVLMHDYFRHPWALISVIAAVIILIFSFLQTFFTIVK